MCINVVFGLPPTVVGAALGSTGVLEVPEVARLIPDNVVQGTDECLARCGIAPAKQPTAQQQPRVSANAFPETMRWKRDAYPQPTVIPVF